jgi:nitrogen regulatory protein P-II 1
MKRIEAVVRRDKLVDVKLALSTVPHVNLTACDTTEHDPRCGTEVRYRNSCSVCDMTPRVSISVLVDDADAGAAVDAIVRAARTGHEGDGTIVVVPVEQLIQVSAVAAVA